MTTETLKPAQPGWRLVPLVPTDAMQVFVHKQAWINAVNAAPLAVQPEERNFCQRCGKPVNLTTIHTCTPPVAADPKAFYGFPQGSVSTPNAGGKCVTAGETAPTKALRKWPSPSAVNDKSLTAR
jgi:hypothetical protein